MDERHGLLKIVNLEWYNVVARTLSCWEKTWEWPEYDMTVLNPIWQ